MQLVLSGTRIVAHGENFLSMGGVVINTATGKKYDNCTIAECNGCPSDINDVGYEYRGGVFVPCAPFGKGDGKGTFMELCNDCKTPRDSGIKVSSLKWETIATKDVDHYVLSTLDDPETVFADENSKLSQYTEIALIAKSGTSFTTDTSEQYSSLIVYAGDSNSGTELINLENSFSVTYNQDTVLFTSKIYPKKRVDTVSYGSGYELVEKMMMHNGDVPALYFVSKYRGRVQGTFELKARGRVDSIIGG